MQLSHTHRECYVKMHAAPPAAIILCRVVWMLVAATNPNAACPERPPIPLLFPSIPAGQSAHDYEYYRASTVAWFMVAEVKAKLERVLGIVH